MWHKEDMMTSSWEGRCGDLLCDCMDESRKYIFYEEDQLESEEQSSSEDLHYEDNDESSYEANHNCPCKFLKKYDKNTEMVISTETVKNAHLHFISLNHTKHCAIFRDPIHNFVLIIDCEDIVNIKVRERN